MSIGEDSSNAIDTVPLTNVEHQIPREEHFSILNSLAQQPNETSKRSKVSKDTFGYQGAEGVQMLEFVSGAVSITSGKGESSAARKHKDSFNWNQNSQLG